MKQLSEIDFGYSDATNYRHNKKYRDMFASVFVKDEKFDRLMRPDTYFLVGDKGTGKTAYAVFLENQEYSNTLSKVVDIANTDYKIFLKLYKMGLIRLSDFSTIWKIIILLLISNEIRKEDIGSWGPRRSEQFEKIKKSINSYYEDAFKPEVSCTFRYLLDNTLTADTGIDAGIKAHIFELGSNGKTSESEKHTEEYSIQKFQNNLLNLEREFSSAFSRLKINKSRFLFVDSIDVKSDDFTSEELMTCIRGLGNAIWDVNTTVFRPMPESNGFLKAVLSIRTDMFPKLNLHNQANRIRDNSVVLDWRTTYDTYKTSPLYKLCNRLLAYNNKIENEIEPWEYYFPWNTKTTHPYRDFDTSFINCLRLSLSRPRDMISIMKALQTANIRNNSGAFSVLHDFEDNVTENEISNYYVDEARDWCLHRFSNDEFITFLLFFQFLNGRSRFSYDEYKEAFDQYLNQVNKRNMKKFDELQDMNDFLQLLYDLNMICYYEIDKNGNEYFRFCYREREIHNLSPQVKINTMYGVHYALLKALNLGKSSGSYIHYIL